MTPEEKESIDKYERLDRVVRSEDWKDIREFLANIVDSSIDHLLDPLADRKLDDFHRAQVAVTESLMSSIHTDHGFGKVNRERIVNKIISKGE